MDLQTLVQNQRQFYAAGSTRSLEFRRKMLRALDAAIRTYEPRLMEALRQDLNKAPFEAYETELGIVYGELRDMLRHLGRWAKPTHPAVSVLHFPASGTVYAEPYGTALILSPWNYPVQLALVPLIGAIGAGNCAVVKPSAYSPATSKVLADLCRETFPPEYVAVVTGGRAENQDLLRQKFDYIFFTGSPAVGRTVMEAAAKFLTPVTLELGGKSPCIVDETADIPLAATRIVWGKLLNAGQTCIAPDYLLVHSRVKDRLVEEMEKAMVRFYGQRPEESPDYPKIINEKHFARLRGLMADGNVLFGGRVNEKTLQMAPTVLDGVTWDSPIMQEEIFGPLFPLLTFDRLEEVLPIIRERPKPLALYLFTTSKAREKQVLEEISFGGGCINDTIVHIANARLFFGGVGESGMGHYHGRATFETFTHRKPVVKKGSWLDLPIRYPPFGDKLKLLRKLQK